MIDQNMKWAAITGASSGIGFELARVFAKNGYSLLIVSGSEKIEEKAKILRMYDVEVRHLVADLSTFKGVQSFYSRIRELNNHLDVLVVNAGVGLGGRFTETDFKEEMNMINLNIVSLVHLTKLVLRDMIARDSGKILFTSSIVAETPGPYLSVYSATKAFVQSFAEAIRFELKEDKRNITVTALQPGATDTNFFHRAGMLNTKVGQAPKDDPAKVAQQGFDALMAGKDHVLGGSVKNKIQATMAKFMSEPMAAKAQGIQSKPMEKET